MKDYSFYKDPAKRTVKPELFSNMAEGLAKCIDQADPKKNKRTQIRKFYDEVVRLNAQARSYPQDWDKILPLVNMIIAKAAYAEGRKLVTNDFVEFLKESIRQVQNAEDLDVFANLFEAFMGFYKKYRPSDN
ncbi:type III-A CRISPR-associated protein Csm2 [Desulforhabdus amnigena]|uniref:CRISPR system Cms protein Csm2 n=1 Tax=Desulforhabdus amnigena TaxID=40218 RepID=A0A9W6CX99_9BACT|nr:type III-A CRISPR-associated protein Csm2 [Desulforhabdus amnigena]GLI34304.1 type III-A CRISPR-associated protein Csm2 [Desulforhabdus amnigena]